MQVCQKLREVAEMFADVARSDSNADLTDEEVERFVDSAIHEFRRKK